MSALIQKRSVAALVLAMVAIRSTSMLLRATEPSDPVSPAGLGPASPAEGAKDPAHVRSALEVGERFAGDLIDLRARASDRGFEWFATNVTEAFGSFGGGAVGLPDRRPGPGAAATGLLHFGFDLDLESFTGGAWPGAAAHFGTFYIYGDSLSERRLGDFSAVSNIDAFRTLRLADFWIEQHLFDDRVSIRAGQLISENEFYSSDYADLFLNGTFGAYTFVAENLPGPPVYPMAAPAVRLKVALHPALYAKAAVFAGSTLDEEENRSSTRFPVSRDQGALIFHELGWLPELGIGSMRLPGHYRIGGFAHTDRDSFPDFDSGETKRGNHGFYFTATQKVWQPSPDDERGLGLFFRHGIAPSSTNFVPFYLDGGINYFGLFPGRPEDVLGIGFAHSRISSAASRANALDGGLPLDHETVIEGTYQINLSERAFIQPSLQYVVNPGGSPIASGAMVAGIRAGFSF